MLQIVSVPFASATVPWRVRLNKYFIVIAAGPGAILLFDIPQHYTLETTDVTSREIDFGRLWDIVLLESTLAIGGHDGVVRLIDAKNGSLIEELRRHDDSITALLFLDPQTLVSGSHDQTVIIWRGGSVSYILKGHDSSITCLAHRGHQLATGSKDGVVRIWDIETGQCVIELALGNGLGNLATEIIFSLDGDKIAVAYFLTGSGRRAGKVGIWNLLAG